MSPSAASPFAGAPRKDHYDVVILGGGGIGLSIAYHLARLGITDVLVLDRDSLVKGATGRNGGGVRAQWTTEENIELARRSIKAFKGFAKDTGHNVFLRQGGYLFLLRTEKQLAAARSAVAFQNEHGVRTRIISTRKAERIVPGLNTEGCIAATFNPDDAVLFPWPIVWGYKDAAERAGVEVVTFAEATGLRTSGGRVTHVETSRGTIGCNWVVNAVGAWAKQVASWGGVDLPNKPERHEILVSEPLKPFLGPMLVDLSTGYYVSQDMRGELVGGLGGDHRESLDWSSSLEFMRDFAKQTVRLMPRLGPVKVLRQWAGSYDVTPDRKPILGVAAAGPDNLVQASGFSGHGMMISPMVGRLIAQLIAGQKPEVDLHPFRLERYAEGDLKLEGMVIG